MIFLQRLRAVARGIAWLSLLLLVTVHCTPLVPLWARAMAGDWTDAKGDILIVLAAEVQSDGVIGYATYWRCVYAIRAWREGGFGTIVVSGGANPPAPESMAASMRDFLLGNGVPGEAIVLEPRSTSTRENALFTAEILRGVPGRKVLLSTDYHTFRAVRTFRKAGVDVVGRPVPHAIKDASRVLRRWELFWALGVETVKVGYYWMKGWI